MSPVTRSSNNYDRCHQTLGIPEVLHMILLEVPMRTLLTSQRVSKTWSSVIQSSKPLQRKLFLEPDAGGLVTLHCKSPLKNPCHLFFGLTLEQFADALHDEVREFAETCDSDAIESPGYMWTRSPLKPKPVRVTANPIIKILRKLSDPVIPWYNQKKTDAWGRSEASWRRMQITQPPVKKAYILSTRPPERVVSDYCIRWVKTIWTQELNLEGWFDRLRSDGWHFHPREGRAAHKVELTGPGLLLWKYDEQADWADGTLEDRQRGTNDRLEHCRWDGSVIGKDTVNERRTPRSGFRRFIKKTRGKGV